MEEDNNVAVHRKTEVQCACTSPVCGNMNMSLVDIYEKKVDDYHDLLTIEQHYRTMQSPPHKLIRASS